MNLRIVTYTPRLHKEFFKVNKKLSLEKLTNPGSANRMSVYPCLSFLKIKPNPFLNVAYLTLSWRRSLSYKNQPIDLQSKSMDWFLHDMDLCHERVKHLFLFNQFLWGNFKMATCTLPFSICFAVLINYIDTSQFASEATD